MSLIEFAIALANAALGVTLLVLALRRTARRLGATRPARAALPVLPLLIALLALLVAPVLGLVLRELVLEHLLLPCFGNEALLLVTSPTVPLLAGLYGGGLLALWLALPGLLASGWLVLSRRRTWTTALLLGILGWTGFGLGLSLGRWLVLPAMLGGLSATMGEASFDLSELARAASTGLAVLGLAGACAPVVWLLSSSSKNALLRVLLASLAMPAGALVIGALTTPPDLISQLLVATLLGLSWLAGLAAGAVTVLLRR